MPRPLLIPAAVLAAYIALVFASVPGNSLIGFPVHHDDYRNLSWIAPTLPEPARPVSGFLLTLLSSLGIPVYYIALHALTAAYAVLVFAALRHLLELRPTPAWLAFPIAIAMLSAECMIEFSQYTGLITGLLSGTAGTAAIVVLLAESRKPQPAPSRLLAAIGLALLSAFSKEDFILPILIAAALVAFEHRTDRRWTATLAAMTAVAAAAFLYNRSVTAVYTSGAGPFYRQDFRLASIAATAWDYAASTRGSATAAVVQGSTLFLNIVAANRIPWLRLAALHAIVAALALPYLCLPNHTAPYYVFHWTPWQFGAGLLVLWQLRPGRPAAAGVLALAMICAATTQHGRYGVMQWYRQMQSLNRNVVRTLEANHDALAMFRQVAVEGAPAFSPWFATSGEFLVNRLGFRNTWLIRVPSDGEFARDFRARAGSLTMGGITVVSIGSELPHGVPILRLAPNGTGTALPPPR